MAARGSNEAPDTTVQAKEGRQQGQAHGRWPPPSAGCRDLPCKTGQGPVAAAGPGASKREATRAGRWHRESLGGRDEGVIIWPTATTARRTSGESPPSPPASEDNGGAAGPAAAAAGPSDDGGASAAAADDGWTADNGGAAAAAKDDGGATVREAAGGAAMDDALAEEVEEVPSSRIQAFLPDAN